MTADPMYTTAVALALDRFSERVEHELSRIPTATSKHENDQPVSKEGSKSSITNQPKKRRRNFKPIHVKQCVWDEGLKPLPNWGTLPEGVKEGFEDAVERLLHEMRSPVPGCWKGNSDPFDSFPVPLTARVFQLVQMDQHFMHQATESLSIFLGPAASIFTTWWAQWSSMFASSDITILGYLARIAAVAGSLISHPDYTMMAVAFKTQGMRRLRSHLEKSANAPGYHQETVHSVTSLLVAELVVDNYQVAAVHLTMLKSFCEDQHRVNSITLSSLFVMTYLDMQYATLSFNPTLLPMDEGNWIEGAFVAAWTQTEARLTLMSATVLQLLDPTLEQCGMHRWFQQLRELYMLLETMLKGEYPSTTKGRSRRGPEFSDWFNVMTRMTCLMSRLNNRVVSQWKLVESEALERKSTAPECSNQGGKSTVPHKVPLRMCIQQVAAIAAIFYTRRFANIDATPATSCASARIHQIGSGALKRLRKRLEMMQRRSTLSDTSEHANLRLWALFVGAQHAEYVGQYCNDKRQWEEEKWMLREFGKPLVSMGISTWEECRNVVNGFLYHPEVKPVPSPGWFERSLQETEPLERPINAPIAVRRWVNVDVSNLKSIKRV